jgi:hypothetical protein
MARHRAAGHPQCRCPCGDAVALRQVAPRLTRGAPHRVGGVTSGVEKNRLPCQGQLWSRTPYLLLRGPPTGPEGASAAEIPGGPHSVRREDGRESLCSRRRDLLSGRPRYHAAEVSRSVPVAPTDDVAALPDALRARAPVGAGTARPHRRPRPGGRSDRHHRPARPGRLSNGRPRTPCTAEGAPDGLASLHRPRRRVSLLRAGPSSGPAHHRSSCPGWVRVGTAGRIRTSSADSVTSSGLAPGRAAADPGRPGVARGVMPDGRR